MVQGEVQIQIQVQGRPAVQEGSNVQEGPRSSVGSRSAQCPGRPTVHGPRSASSGSSIHDPRKAACVHVPVAQTASNVKITLITQGRAEETGVQAKPPGRRYATNRRAQSPAALGLPEPGGSSSTTAGRPSRRVGAPLCWDEVDCGGRWHARAPSTPSSPCCRVTGPSVDCEQISQVREVRERDGHTNIL